MTVHFVAHFTVNDKEGYHVYEKGFFPILKAHGGRFVTFDDNVTVLEGERADGRTVIIEFDNEEACMGWWNSPEYQELAEHRKVSTTSHAIFVAHPIPSRS